MYFAFCPGPEGPGIILVLLALVLAAACVTVVGLLFAMKLVNDWRKRRVMLTPHSEDAGDVLGH